MTSGPILESLLQLSLVYESLATIAINAAVVRGESNGALIAVGGIAEQTESPVSIAKMKADIPMVGYFLTCSNGANAKDEPTHRPAASVRLSTM